MSETKTIVQLERKYLTSERRNTILLFEDDDINWYWDESELTEIADMWASGGDVRKIAWYMKRDADEILLALIHLARQGKIEQRPGGLL